MPRRVGSVIQKRHRGDYTFEAFDHVTRVVRPCSPPADEDVAVHTLYSPEYVFTHTERRALLDVLWKPLTHVVCSIRRGWVYPLRAVVNTTRTKPVPGSFRENACLSRPMLHVTLFSLLLTTVTCSRVSLPTIRVPSAVRPRAAIHLAEAETQAIEDEEEKEERLGAGGRGGHAVRGQPELSEEEKIIQTKVMEHQKSAARLTNAEDARSLVGYSTGYAVLSTLSKSLDGYPSGSVVGFAPDENGLPVFCFSTMSSRERLGAEPTLARAELYAS